ncbi:MAG: c-type cytochrome [Flavobacteriia bacterium]|jgi:mono/diheme cytochrome c family protein
MVLRTVFFFSFAFSFVSCSGNNDTVAPENNEGTPLDSGKTLFEQNCAACHGNDGKLGVSGAKDLTTSTMNEEQIEKIIRDGKNGMPPMKSLLGSDENIKSVTDYVKSMNK